MSNQENIRERYAQAMGEFAGHNYDRSITMLTEILDDDPGFALGYTSRGAAFLRKNDPARAVADFDAAVATDPGYAKAYHLRGLARSHMGDDIKAAGDFDKAIALDPEYGAAYYSRANLHAKRGKEEQAREDMEMAAHLTNRNIDAFANENNIWRSEHLNVENALESEMQR